MDTLVGTDLKDTFIGELLSINSFDSLDGGLGNDTAKLTLNTDLSSEVKLTSIETVSITDYGTRNVDMENMTGVKAVYTEGSTGSITLNNITDAGIALGFKGVGANNINAFYQDGALEGTNDTINIILDAAKKVTVEVESGFESANIKVSGDSAFQSYTVPGVDTLTITGSGSLNLGGTVVGVQTVNAAAFEGALTTGTVNATTGYVGGMIEGNSEGTTLLMGSGNDNIGFTGVTSQASSSNTIKLGAGDDRAVLDLGGEGATNVFGEDGDDMVRATGTALTSEHFIDLGAGDDTLNIDVSGSMVNMSGVENLTLTKNASSVTLLVADDDLNVPRQLATQR